MSIPRVLPPVASNATVAPVVLDGCQNFFFEISRLSSTLTMFTRGMPSSLHSLTIVRRNLISTNAICCTASDLKPPITFHVAIVRHVPSMSCGFSCSGERVCCVRHQSDPQSCSTCLKCAPRDRVRRSSLPPMRWRFLLAPGWSHVRFRTKCQLHHSDVWGPHCGLDVRCERGPGKETGRGFVFATSSLCASLHPWPQIGHGAALL